MKNIRWSLVFSVISVVICVWAVLIVLYLFFTSNNIVPAQVHVYGKELSIDAQEKINNAIISNIENIYNRLIANIQISIALFSIFLIIFSIIFGMIYFSKIRDSEKLIKDIQDTPDMFFDQFYIKQYNENMIKLLSQNHVQRNDALNKLYTNTIISSNDYETLQDVFIKEFGYNTSIYFHQNINSIVSIMIKLDYSRTISFLIDILHKNKYDHMKHYHLLNYITSDPEDNTKTFIKNQLLNDTQMSNQIVSLLASNRLLNDYFSHILENCHGSTLQTALSMSYSDIWNIETDNFFEYITKREDIDIENLQLIISHKTVDIKEIISITLYFFYKNNEKFTSSINYLINSICENENAKEIFIQLSEEMKYQEILQVFFSKNEHLISYFSKYRDNCIFLRASSENKEKHVIFDIKEKELKISKDGKLVIDKNGVEYKIGQYCYSVFTGSMLPVKTGIIIDNTFVDIEELEKIKKEKS